MIVAASLWTSAARATVLVLLVTIGMARLRASAKEEFERGRWLGYALLATAAVNMALWTLA